MIYDFALLRSFLEYVESFSFVVLSDPTSYCFLTKITRSTMYSTFYHKRYAVLCACSVLVILYAPIIPQKNDNYY